MPVKFLSILLTLLLLQVSCSSSSGDSRASGADGDSDADNSAIDGDGETDADIDSDAEADSDDEGLSDGDGETTACVNGQAGCEGASLTVCRDDEWCTIANCAENGWICEDGQCIASGEETETEVAYRTRLNELRIKNAGSNVQLDPYGGWMNAPESFGEPDPGEYFRVKKINGRWWFITPDGYPFISKGVTDVNYLGPNLSDDSFHEILVDKYGDEETWADASLARLKEWSFNNVGPWSGESMVTRMPHAEPIMDSAGHAPRYAESDFVTDYWSEGFSQNARQVAIDRATPHVNDEFLIGYFLDNELFWGADWRTDKTMLQAYLDFPVEAPGRVEALHFIKEQAASLEEFNSTWGTTLESWDDLPILTSNDLSPDTDNAKAVSEDFTVLAFNRYASIAIAGLRAVDSNHLILGCRFAWYPGDALVRAAGKVFDVISMAGYHKNWVDELDTVYPETDRPFLIEEFSFKAKDSGLPNIMNYAIVVETQKDRALAFDTYVESFIRRPYAVAYHWYKWFDNPTDGFIAGDNFGLMNSNDDPYQDFVTYIREVNFQAEIWHAEGVPETR